MVETGRVIHKRYLLQRVIEQSHVCTIYQAVDQVLQRRVVVKVVPGPYMAAYRSAIRLTSQFSHPNIVGIYDVIMEPESLYVVQEYVEGDPFSRLLQLPLSAYEVTNMGVGICSALLYASASSRKVCHGDLTPSAVMRDQLGNVRVNNFALPSDLSYFERWRGLGGASTEGDVLADVLADSTLPWGQCSDGRRADDTRAVGLLLYQLLAGRAPGATTVEPPPDGRLRFMRNAPAELCEIIARALVPQHPQHITTVETLYAELKTVQEDIESSYSAASSVPQPAEDGAAALPQPAAGKLVTALPMREAAPAGLIVPPPHPDVAAAPFGVQEPVALPAAQTVADIPVKLAAARQAAYPSPTAEPHSTRRLSLPLLLLIGLVVFALFFAVGYFAANVVFPH